MLIRNCEKENICKLLHSGDCNIRVTPFYTVNTRYLQESLVRGAWEETIRDSLGGGIIHSENLFALKLTTIEHPEYFQYFQRSGKNLVDTIISHSDITAIRISIEQEPFIKGRERSWIILPIIE